MSSSELVDVTILKTDFKKGEIVFFYSLKKLSLILKSSLVKYRGTEPLENYNLILNNKTKLLKEEKHIILI